MSASPIEFEPSGSVIVLRFNRPPANAIDHPFVRELDAALASLEARDEAEAVVVTGTGRFFSAGLDLKALPHLAAAEQREMAVAFGRLMARLYGFPRPVVAAVNGHAVAGGLLLTLTTDYRIGTPGSSTFGLTGVKAGIPYPESALAVAAGELTPSVARTMLLTARTCGPQTAVARGILDELVPSRDLLPRALGAAGKLAEMPSEAYVRTKRQLRGPVLDRIHAAIDGGHDARPGAWLTPESSAASARLLER